jgi:nicotinate-nucleotide adenylyltransferase
MNAGLMGGTFDPIHYGHLRAAENARQELGLDQVVFMPTGEPPHRPGARASGGDRLRMTELAVSSHADFVVSDLEVQREGRSYTVETLEELHEQRPDVRWTLILGSDAYAEMATWRQPGRVLELASLAVVARPGTPLPQGGPPAVAVSSSELLISSTRIRAELKEGRSVRYLVPDAVLDHIAQRGLYR